MSRIVRVFCILVILMSAVPAALTAQASPAAIPANCQETLQPDNETYLICFPSPAAWNGDLVVFAHGYVFFNPADPKPYMPYEQIQLPAGVGTGNIWLPSILNALGYGFAMTSYRKEGLAVQEGIQDIRNLVSVVRARVTATNAKLRSVYVVGASEGGLVTTLLMERYPSEFRGGLSLCGPVGDFQKQVNYWGDFRAVLDALFPGVLPADAVNIPPELMLDWASPTSQTQQTLLNAMTQAPLKTSALIQVSKAAVDPNDLAGSTPATVKGILDYNIFATNEARIELGLVQPYSNIGVTYSGSGDPGVDALINAAVTRYAPIGDVAAAIKPYQTSGVLKSPLVNMHTTLDPIVPFWHQALYQAKVFKSLSFFKYNQVGINRYGHCNFKLSEMLYGFLLMVFRSSFQAVPLAAYHGLMPDEETYTDILTLNQENVDITQAGGQTVFLPLVNR